MLQHKMETVCQAYLYTILFKKYIQEILCSLEEIQGNMQPSEIQDHRLLILE